MTTASDARSDRALAYRRWYKTKRWHQRRHDHLNEEPLCRMCKAEGRVTAATVVDHVIPHRGIAELFWDRGNLQSLCDLHHSGAKQSEERVGYSSAIANDGWPIDARHPANNGRG